jgi:hypothetical protein
LSEFVDSSGIDWNVLDGERKGRGRRNKLRAVGDDERHEPSETNNDWSLGLPKNYDPEKFYIKSTDEKGHQVSVKNINVPQNLGAALGLVLEYFPEYRTYADIARDGLMHVLVMRIGQKTEGKLTPMMKTELSMRRAYYLNARMEHELEHVEMYRGMFEKAMENRDYAVMDEGITSLEEHLNDTEVDETNSPYIRQLNEMLAKYRAEMKRVRESGAWVDGPK